MNTDEKPVLPAGADGNRFEDVIFMKCSTMVLRPIAVRTSSEAAAAIFSVSIW